MKNLTVVNIISAMEKAFDAANNRFYGGAIPRPVITIAEGAKARAYGWVSVAPVWHDKDGTSAHELNISSEYLNRDFREVVDTLLHEMVHLENIRLGVQDTARTGIRHNKKFSDCADAHGLEGYKGEDFDKVGFRCRMTEETAQTFLPEIDFLREALTIYRDETGAGKIKKGKNNAIKMVCPVCGVSCRATKQIFILCGDCEEQMLPEA